MPQATIAPIAAPPGTRNFQASSPPKTPQKQPMTSGTIEFASQRVSSLEAHQANQMATLS